MLVPMSVMIVIVMVMVVIMAAAALRAMGMAVLVMRMLVVLKIMAVMIIAVMMIMIMARMIMVMRVALVRVTGMVVIVRMMIVRVAMIVAAMLVGAAFRLERPLDLDDLGAKPLQHLGDDMILPDPQPFRPDLGLQVPVAEVPGNAGLMQGIASAHFQQRFGFGDDVDEAAVLQRIGIAMTEGRRLGQIDQDLQAAHCRDHAAPPPAVLEGQDDAVDRLALADLVEGNEGMGMEHGRTSEQFAPL